MLDGIFWLMRTGAPSARPAGRARRLECGLSTFRRWADSGVWDLILEALGGSEVSDTALQMIDATTIGRALRGRRKGD